MKTKLLFLMLVALISYTSNVLGQVAINNDQSDPDASAMLDISSTEKGILIPRMTTTQRTNLPNPAEGLLVFDTETNSFWYYNSDDTLWVELGSGSGSADNDWMVSGDKIYNANSGNVGIGTTNPNAKLHIRNGNLLVQSQFEDAYIKLMSDEEEDITPSYLWSENAKGFAVGKTPGTPLFLVNTYNGNVGIGTTNPTRKLSIRDGNMSLVSEGSDSYIYLGSNELADAIGSYVWTKDGVGFAIGKTQDVPQFVIKNYNGNVGIGTESPDAKLEIAGQVKITGGTPGEGKVLTSDTDGLASWQNTAGGGAINDLTDGKTDATSVFLGENAGTDDDGSDNSNVALGISALAINTSGYNNVAIGNEALAANGENPYYDFSSANNVAVGYHSLHSNTLGHSNIAVGSMAMLSNTSGQRNTALGKKALNTNTTGYDNVALGYETLVLNETGYFNIALGSDALRSFTDGNRNIAIGKSALYYLENSFYNIALGSSSLFNLTSGSKNVAIGNKAGYTNELGEGNIFLGYQAGYSETGSNKLYIDNSNTAYPLIYGDFDIDHIGLLGKVGINTKAPIGELQVHSKEKSHNTLYITPKSLASGDSTSVFLAEDSDATYGMYWMYNGTNDRIELYGKAGEVIYGSHFTIDRNDGDTYFDGNMAIGGDYADGYMLSVSGKVICEEVRVNLKENWPDYVFKEDYNLIPIADLESYINDHGHLPNVLPAKEIEESGLEMGETQRIMMEKIEELTLYIIEQQKQIDALKNELKELK